jgi:hypothetical protein
MRWGNSEHIVFYPFSGALNRFVGYCKKRDDILSNSDKIYQTRRYILEKLMYYNLIMLRTHSKKFVGFGWSVGLSLLALAVVSQAAPPAKKEEPVPLTPTYNRDIRPILAENCFPCHGPDSASRKAGLRIDKYGDAIALRESGKRTIVPGDPISSELVARILKPDNDALRMPPSSGHKALTDAQKKTVLRWIEQGAKYESHWSYIAPKRSALPAVKNAAWVRNPIDRFTLSKLEANGLTPAPEADRRTLARRLSLDLTGLPPDPADVEKFVADKSPDYYEKYVDKMMASPRWGEHRSRYWLDGARYADSNGIHFDNYREMWAYRDWVINAYNKNMPFDQFTVEQLAGDLLPSPTLDQKVATGFTRCNITTNEGGAIDEEYNVLYTRDRTETASQVFMGATTGCAVCHDHKFDPISQKEFYQLAAFFNNTTQRAMDGNIKDTPPVVPVPMPEDRNRFAALNGDKGEIALAKKAQEARKVAAAPDFDKWSKTIDRSSFAPAIPTEGMTAFIALNEGQGRALTAELNTKTGAQTVKASLSADNDWTEGIAAAKAFQKKTGISAKFPEIGDRENNEPFSAAVWVKLAPNNGGGAIFARMDEANDFRGWDLWIEGNRVATHFIHKWPEDALKVVTRDMLPPGKWHHVVMTYDGGMKKESIKIYIDGVDKATDPQAESLKGSTRTNVPFALAQRNTTSAMEGTAIQDVRLFRRALTAEDARKLAQGTATARISALLASVQSNKPLSDTERADLMAYYLNNADLQYPMLTATVAKLEGEIAAIQQRGTIAHIANERGEEAMAYVLFRGEYDKRRDAVKPITPTALPAFPANYPKNRLGFARWLLLPTHPLTARVTVNRYWQELFGVGIVKTAGDFGIMGEAPSHPELLDWMAVEYREKGWDTKNFFKMMVTSATYRQSAIVTPEKRRKDPANRLLSRGPRFRMDAEMVRDYALAASGTLSPKIGGPSVKPYQPDGVWEAVAMIGSNTRDYKRDTGESLYRRSMYTFWKRAAPPASMDIFNAPAREVCTMRRERTNTPLQALVTMNDEQFVEAARNLAQKAVKAAPTMEARFDYLSKKILARPLKPQEAQILESSLADIAGYYVRRPEDAKLLVTVGESKPDATVPTTQLAAWTMLTNQMMNLDEALNK